MTKILWMNSPPKRSTRILIFRIAITARDTPYFCASGGNTAFAETTLLFLAGVAAVVILSSL